MLKTDLLIIGGGINGVGVAAEAASRGLNVILCEKADLASGTSSNSTKLIHGGLRYLEQGQFHLVMESLRERAILLKRAPQLVHPLKFILPLTLGQRAAWQIQLGLKLYDWLAGRRKLTRSGSLPLSAQNPLKNHYKKAFSYYDTQTDDARLVILNAILAQAYGAKILSQTECVKAEIKQNNWLVTLKSGELTQQVQARAVVNAAGCSTASVLQHIFKIAPSIQTHFVKGSHIVIPKLYDEQHAYTLQSEDGRIIFTIPYENDYTLIGTTDVFVNNPAIKAEITSDELAYLIYNINKNFTQQIKAADVVWSYSGIRCLAGQNQANPSLISREHKIDINLTLGAPIISLFGGKLTTYRAIASSIVDQLRIYFPLLKSSTTQNLLLPGGDFGTSFTDFRQKLQARYSWLPEEIVQRYAKSYGSLCYQFLNDHQTLQELGFDFGAGLYQAEVDYLIKNEWANSMDDILWRRTKLGLKAEEIQLESLEKYMASTRQKGA